jgi:glycosyltransferase involved in cell wall biosynthesis
MRVAWFSPVPPVKSGIAGRTAELVEVLRARGHQIDVYVDEPIARTARDVRSAHDFVWRHAQQPYDLTLFQFGNSSHHDYEWAYAFRYPGLVVLHDTHLHHARAAFLLRELRPDDYRAEFAFDDPQVSADLAELAVNGFDSALYYRWPLVRTLVSTSRRVVTHGEEAAKELQGHFTDSPSLAARISNVTLGEGEAVSLDREISARRQLRLRYGVPADAILLGVFGGIAPEKRIDRILDAFEAVLPAVPSARLLLAGAPASHYDLTAALAAYPAADRVVVTGYVEGDDALTDHIAACDVTLNLRWPSARETSGPWLRALAAGRPTVITDLVHLRGVPSIDPRTWRGNQTEDPVCVAIDILDEDHSLRLALRRLGTDAALRTSLGRAAAAWWAREHTVGRMADDYERVMDEACRSDAPLAADVPGHVRGSCDATLRAVAEPFGASVSECIRAFSAD